MIKLLLGPALALVTYIAGSIYGRDAEQIVHKSPATVYAALENLVAGSNERSATLTREDGRKVPTALAFAAKDADKSATIQLTFDGQPGVSADVTLTPQEDGAATLMAVKLHGDKAVLRDMLHGTQHARLAYAPDWLLNITFRPVLGALAEDIEKGQGFSSIPAFTRDAELSAEQQQQMSQWRQYESTQPMSDPNADARKYLNGGN